MKVIACSLYNPGFGSPEEYYCHMLQLLDQEKPELAVLPAHSALLFAQRCGFLENQGAFQEVVKAYLAGCRRLTPEYLELHAALARAAGTYLVPGTFLEEENGFYYHSSALIGSDGQVLGRQRQAHLTREEQAAGLTRGIEIKTFSTLLGTIGLLVHTDAWYPEVSRILGLQGAEIVCHPGSIPGSWSPWYQLCGMWKEVQQNQFFGVESQLAASLAGVKFIGRSAVLAPCEMTSDKSGYLARSSGKQESTGALLDFGARREVIQAYPLYAYLNPAAYSRHMPSLYTRENEGSGS